MQTAAIVVSVAVTLVAVALAGRAIGQIVGVIRLGQPVLGRTDQPGRRTVTMLRETLGHTRMLKWSLIGASHWFVFIGFGLLFFTLLTAYGQLFDAEFVLPVIGGAHPFEWAAEVITWAMLVGITLLVAIRLRAHPARTGRTSRFTGSRMWQGYYVEATVIGVGICILVLRGLEYALGADDVSHFPLTFFIGDGLAGLPTSTLENLVYLVAAVKILISMAWLIVIALNVTMGVAWHRFTAFPNVYFKREADGANALGAAQPLTVNGQPVDFEKLDELDGCDARCRQGRGLLLEGAARLHHMHGVRSLSVPVSGLEHRQAAVAEAAGHGAAGARLREGAVPAGGWGRSSPATNGRLLSSWPTFPSPRSPRPTARSSARLISTALWILKCCGPARHAAPASSNAQSTSSTSTTSWTCVGTRR